MNTENYEQMVITMQSPLVENGIDKVDVMLSPCHGEPLIRLPEAERWKCLTCNQTFYRSMLWKKKRYNSNTERH